MIESQRNQLRRRALKQAIAQQGRLNKSNIVFYQGRDPDSGHDLVERDGEIIKVWVTGNAQPIRGMALTLLDGAWGDLPFVLGPSKPDVRRRFVTFPLVNVYQMAILFLLSDDQTAEFEDHYYTPSIGSPQVGPIAPFPQIDTLDQFSLRTDAEGNFASGEIAFDPDATAGVTQINPAIATGITVTKGDGQYPVALTLNVIFTGDTLAGGELTGVDSVQLDLIIHDLSTPFDLDAPPGDIIQVLVNQQTPVAFNQEILTGTPLAAGSYFIGFRLSAVLNAVTDGYIHNWAIQAFNLVVPGVTPNVVADLYLGGDRAPILLRQLEFTREYIAVDVLVSGGNALGTGLIFTPANWSGGPVSFTQSNRYLPAGGGSGFSYIANPGRPDEEARFGNFSYSATRNRLFMTGSGNANISGRVSVAYFDLPAGVYRVFGNAVAAIDGTDDLTATIGLGVPGNTIGSADGTGNAIWGRNTGGPFLGVNGAFDDVIISTGRRIIGAELQGLGRGFTMSLTVDITVQALGIKSYVSGSRNRLFVYAEDEVGGHYFIIEGQTVTEISGSIVGDPDDWKRSLIDDSTDPDPCFQSYKNRQFANAQSGRLIEVNPTEFNAALVAGRPYAGATITTTPISSEAICVLGDATQAEALQIQALIPPTETRTPRISAIAPYLL